MIILWIRKNKSDLKRDITGGGIDSFQEHDDTMKKFRLAHPDVNMVEARDIVTEEGNLLAPVHRVKLADYIQN